MKKIENLFLYFIFVFIAMFAHPRLTYEFSTPKYFFLVIFIAALIALWVIRKVVEKKLDIYLSWMHFGYFLFGTAAVVASFSMLKENPLYFPFSFELGCYTFLTVIIVIFFSNFFESKKEIVFFLTAVLAAGFMVAIEALMNYYYGQSFFLGNYGTTGKMAMKATIGNPNFVSDFLASVMPITVYFAISNNFGWKSEKPQKKSLFFSILAIKVFALVQFFLYYLVVLLASTRAVFLALLAGFAFMGIVLFLYRKKIFTPKPVEVSTKLPVRKLITAFNRLNYISIGILLLIFFFLPIILTMPNNILQTNVDVFERTGSSFESRGFQTTGGKGRLLAWLAAIYQWKDYPIIGNGLGTYKLKDTGYLADVMNDQPQFIDVWNNYKRTHNDYLQVLGEMGLFGFLSVLFTLVIMIILFFKIFKRQETVDDMILLLLFAVCFIEILGHCLTEFPLQMLPNQLWAMALAGIGFGSYFNKSFQLAKKITFKKSVWLLCLLAVLGISVLTGMLKFNSFMAEVFFKDGNAFYSYLSQIESAKSDLAQQEQKYLTASESLVNRTAEYAKFNQDVYVQRKLSTYNLMTMTEIAKSQLNLKILGELEKEVQAENAKFETVFAQIETKKNEYQNLSSQYYTNAMDSFLTSIQRSAAFGKSFFYAALLMTRTERKVTLIDEFNNTSDRLSVLKKHFTGVYRDTQYVLPEYRQFLLAKDYEFLASLLEQGYSFQELINELQVSLWYDIQMNQDSLNYFQTSFRAFSEKNTYRIMGKVCFTLQSQLKTLINAYETWKINHPESANKMEEVIQTHRLQVESKISEMQTWMDEAIYVLPGSWQLFPDWENIYAEYVDLFMRLGEPAKYYSKIKEIVNKRLWAAEYMHQAQQLAVPDEIVQVYMYLIKGFHDQQKYQESLMLYKESVDILQKAYEWNQIDFTQNPYLNEEQKNRISVFLAGFEKLKKDFTSYLDQVLQLYKRTGGSSAFENDLSPEWRLNELTGEKWDEASYDKILERVESLR